MANEINALNEQQAREFAEVWLPAWTGNQPEKLADFYTDDAFYLDPSIPEGVQGREAIVGYFKVLLGNNPEWIWTHRGSIPMKDGFVNKWHASIPVGPKTLEIDGVCLVQLRDGLIYRNEVYFDTHLLLSEIKALLAKNNN